MSKPVLVYNKKLVVVKCTMIVYMGSGLLHWQSALYLICPFIFPNSLSIHVVPMSLCVNPSHSHFSLLFPFFPPTPFPVMYAPNVCLPRFPCVSLFLLCQILLQLCRTNSADDVPPPIPERLYSGAQRLRPPAPPPPPDSNAGPKGRNPTAKLYAPKKR